MNNKLTLERIEIALNMCIGHCSMCTLILDSIHCGRKCYYRMPIDLKLGVA